MTQHEITPGVVWLSMGEAAKFYGVSRRALYNWIAADKVVTRRTPGGLQRVAISREQWALSEDEARKVKGAA